MNIISQLKKKIGENSFGKNITLIAGGTAVSQALTIIFSPIITRLYPPEEYGVLTAYIAVLSLLSISASLDYQKAIPIAEDDEKAVNLLILSIFILLTAVILVTILLEFYGEYFLSLVGSEILSSFSYLIPLGVLFTGVYNIVLEWGFRGRDYNIITRTKVSQSVAANITKFSLGLLKTGPMGLILGAIIGQSAGITSLAFPVVKNKKLLSKVSIDNIKYVAKRYKKFPFYSAPSNYVYTAGSNMPVVLLTSIFGTSVTGLFGLANSIINLPMSLIGNSVAQVFYSEAARIGKSNPKEIKRLSIKLVKKLAVIALFPLVILLFFGPWLFSFVFGTEWYEAGVYARILSVMVYFHFLILPIGRMLEIFERQREGLLFNIVRLLMVIFVFFLSNIFNFSSYQTIAMYSLSNSITYLALLFLVMKIINQEIKKTSE